MDLTIGAVSINLQFRAIAYGLFKFSALSSGVNSRRHRQTRKVVEDLRHQVFSSRWPLRFVVDCPLLKGATMQTFQGNLLIGGLALNNVEGMLCDDESGAPSNWSGKFRVDLCQHEALEIDRQYLLMLDDGRNREVVLTEIQVESEDGGVVCAFEDLPSVRRPK